MNRRDHLPLTGLRPEDLERHPVWQYVDDSEDAAGDPMLRAVRKLPVRSLAGRVVGAEVVLRNSDRVWALLGNIDPVNEPLTRHFLTLSMFRNDDWFTLARYHDVDYRRRGPTALAAFLDLPVERVFPIRYDVRRSVVGLEEALAGVIRAEPVDPLTREQVIALAVPKRADVEDG